MIAWDPRNTYYFYFVIRNQKAVEVSGDAFAQR